ncbi:MAG: divergent polysaccharide deacetylase family protein [Treponema sp.]|nr:divergent polysaccharide deacetylase family protein [Treponema sp.]
MKKTVKNGKNSKKTIKKRKKWDFSDGFKAILLVGVIVLFSAGISLAVIMVHKYFNNDGIPIEIDDQNQTAAEPDVIHVDIPEIENSITVQPPVNQPQVRSNPVVTPPVPTPAASPLPSAVPTTRPNTTPAFGNISPSSSQAQRPSENLGSVVFVIDDAGNNLRELDPFLRLPMPLTIAVLPGLPYSVEAANRIRASGKEVILHQPMEAIGAQNPGPGAIYTGMSAEEIREILSRNIAEVGPVSGINNHQGSKITMDREAVETILSFCAERGIYYLDSRTTPQTVVPAVAGRLGIRIVERNVFIDNEQDKSSMQNSITGGLERAQRDGVVVMIGHTWSPQLAPLLAEQYSILIRQGYTIKTASDILR